MTSEQRKSVQINNESQLTKRQDWQQKAGLRCWQLHFCSIRDLSWMGRVPEEIPEVRRNTVFNQFVWKCINSDCRHKSLKCSFLEKLCLCSLWDRHSVLLGESETVAIYQRKISRHSFCKKKNTLSVLLQKSKKCKYLKSHFQK